LSDHPNPGNRQQAIQQEVRNWPPKNYMTNSAEFPQIKQAALKVKAYSAQEIANGAKSGQWEQQNRQNHVVPANLPSSSSSNQGNGTASGNGPAGSGGAAAENVSFKDVKPSDHLTRFEGQGFTMYYPDNWKAGGDQNSTMFVPPSGAAQTGISYGVIVGNQPGGGGSLDDATQKLAQGMAQENPGMTISGQMKPIEINGTQGRSLELSGKSPLTQNGQPLPERDWLVTVPRPQGGLAYLVFVSPERDFNQLHATYQKMLESLQLQ
jgi:beta-barrel assembly-enhancing protease